MKEIPLTDSSIELVLDIDHYEPSVRFRIEAASVQFSRALLEDTDTIAATVASMLRRIEGVGALRVFLSVFDAINQGLEPGRQALREYADPPQNGVTYE